MQCANCRFQNMPGSRECGRCGTSLALATAVMDVHPPRASRAAKRLRRAVPVRRAYYRARDEARGAAAGARGVVGNEFIAAVPPLPLLLRLVVPGWTQLHAGQRWQARVLLGSYLAVLVPALLWFGSTASGILFGIAFSIHSWAAADVLNQRHPETDTVARRTARSILVSIALAAAVYWPGGWLVSRVAAPRVIELTAAPFVAGDVVLVNQLASPAVGSVVLYDLPVHTLRTDDGGEHTRRYLRFAGERVDRILAGPGDDVRWEYGQLFVNGVAVARRPLNLVAAPGRLQARVPGGQFFILPSNTTGVVDPTDTEAWMRLSLVPAGNIRGPAYVRSHPLSRFGRIR